LLSFKRNFLTFNKRLNENTILYTNYNHNQ